MTTKQYNLVSPLKKKIQLNEIISIEEVSYRPLWEFGGLGWRIGRAGKMANGE